MTFDIPSGMTVSERNSTTQPELDAKSSLTSEMVLDLPVPGSPGDSHHDHEHVPDPPLRDLPITLWNIPRFIPLAFIRLYQATFSRALPAGTCRFYPSCSHYGYQAIYRYGIIKGGWLATWRVLRCNPINKGGFDPVP